MSRYAYLACEDCKIIYWLGKIVTPREDPAGVYFHIGSADEPPNSLRPEVTKVVMRFLAQHMGHTLRVWPEELMEKRISDDHRAIGNAADGDIPEDDYIRGFRG